MTVLRSSAISLFLMLFVPLLCLGEQYSVDEFRAKLGMCINIPDSEFPHENRQDREEPPPLPDACSFLDSGNTLSLPGGEKAELDTGYLVNEYEKIPGTGDEDERSEQVERFREMAAYLKDSLPELLVAKQTAGFADFEISMKEILERDEFREKEPLIKSLIPESLKEWVRRIMGRTPGLNTGLDLPDWLGALFRVAIFIGLMLLLGYFVYMAYSKTSMAKIGEDAAGPREYVPVSRGEIFSRADEFAGRGDFRSALRVMYISFVKRLEISGMVSYTDTKTNGEYLLELSQSRPVSGELRSMTSMYEYYWYGMSECTGEAYGRFRNLYSSCLDEIAR